MRIIKNCMIYVNIITRDIIISIILIAYNKTSRECNSSLYRGTGRNHLCSEEQKVTECLLLSTSVFILY